jgi:2-polyprenyl-3-methyl-5-hydroxy-6-metoxy-1,4-benzoquinol methylase
MSKKPNSHEIASQTWPAEGLERLGRCPVCGVEDRTLLHAELWDSGFFVAPGRWTMWRCDGCRSGYLDPRPDAASIGLAYSNYYTHRMDEAAQQPRTVRTALGNGYRNHRYGTSLEPSLAIGRVVALAFPGFRRSVDSKYRYLPRAFKGGQRRVLDIGCGNGEWLLLAREAGWTAVGSDPDPVAQAGVAELGLEVRQGGAEAWEDQPGSFDAISMSHVIEHVHDPVDTLRRAFEMLRPGGQLFIECPNVDALGHSIYGANWRGLEPPRHLVLFNRRSLSEALSKRGFVNLRHRSPPDVFAELSMRSARIAAGLDPHDESAKVDVPPAPRSRRALAGDQAEYLTVTCDKPN